MKRREILWLLVASTGAWSRVSNAQQQTPRIYRVGYLGSGTINQPLQHTLLERLRDLGWIEGKNLSIDYRFAEGRYDALADLANELVQLGVDVIVASPTPAALAAKKATQTIPIVGIGFDNPIENELVASLARPGGNVTGLSYGVGPDIFGKEIELLREVLPHVTVVAVLSNPSSPNHAAMMSNVGVAAHKLDIRLVPQDVSEPGQIEERSLECSGSTLVRSSCLATRCWVNIERESPNSP
jgi:putative ABC transport system substrate-binding protein